MRAPRVAGIVALLSAACAACSSTALSNGGFGPSVEGGVDATRGGDAAHGLVDGGAAACSDPHDAGRCSATRPPGMYAPDGGHRTDAAFNGPGARCTVDDQCVYDGGTNGRCEPVEDQGPDANAPPEVFGECTFDLCFADDDCPPGQLCTCGPVGGNSCQPSNCRTDADCLCGPCGQSFSIVNCAPKPPEAVPAGHFCWTPNDTCHTNADCSDAAGPLGSGGACAWVPTIGVWACIYQTCAG